MIRVLIWLIGWTVFLGLTLASAFVIARMIPYEENGQEITGAGMGFCLMWCPTILVFSALASLLIRALMRQAGLTDKKKKSLPHP